MEISFSKYKLIKKHLQSNLSVYNRCACKIYDDITDTFVDIKSIKIYPHT